MSTQNFMGRIDIVKSADAAAEEPYVVLAQLDYEAQDNIQTLRLPLSSVGKLIGKLDDYLKGGNL